MTKSKTDIKKEVADTLNISENAIEDINQSQTDNKPTQEDIDRFKAEFEAEVETFKSLQFNIIIDDEIKNNVPFTIIDVAKFLDNLNTNNVVWSKDLWQGIIKFNEFIKDQISKIEEGQEEIQFSYQPLEYLYFILSNPAGTGLASAQEFEKNLDMYTFIFEQIENNVVSARKMLQEIEIAQQRWAAAEQGFFLEVERDEESELDNCCREENCDCKTIPTAEGEIGLVENE